MYFRGMKFHVYRARRGFVLSSEYMQAPIAVQKTHPAVCECGTCDLPAESVQQVLGSVAHNGFAIVEKRDPIYAVMDRLCTERRAETAE